MRSNKVVILGGHNATLLIGYPYHLCILYAITCRQVEGMPRIVNLFAQPVRKPTRELGVHHEFHAAM
jgi:hypothetical protein